MKIEFPTHCPACNSLLEEINGQLFCKNTTSCSAQNAKTVENFCKKLKLKGFGKATLDKLELFTISDLFNVSEEKLIEGTSQLVGKKLFAQLEKLKTAISFSEVLAALGIPLIGTVAASKVATSINSFQELNKENLEKTTLGSKAKESLLEWSLSNKGKEISTLQWVFSRLENNVSVLESQIDVCITGKLLEFSSRNAAKEFLISKGFNPKDSVTKTVKYLINEENDTTSSKYKKAVTLGIPIVTIKQLLEIVEEQL